MRRCAPIPQSPWTDHLEEIALNRSSGASIFWQPGKDQGYHMRHWHQIAILRSVAVLLTCALWTTAAVAETAAISRQTATIAGEELRVFSYHPKGCASPSILMIFHGNSRSARSYLEGAVPLADRACFSLYAPLFDKARFPNWSYHRGGLVHDGRLQPEEEWTVELVDDLVDWAQASEGNPRAPVFLFGHSAGAQFLSRVAAYTQPEDDVRRIILANPSTYVLPDNDEDVPYGYGGLPDEDQATVWMRDYLAAPITIYLGEDDTGGKSLTMTRAATRQGSNRVTRGEQTFQTAKTVAETHGWPFNWTLVHADDVGHSARGMLQSEAMAKAMGF